MHQKCRFRDGCGMCWFGFWLWNGDTAKRKVKNITVNEWEFRRSLMRWSVLWWWMDLKTLFWVSKNIWSGLLFVGAATGRKDCKSVKRLTTKLASKCFISLNPQHSPFLSAGWVNLESHCCCDETVIFFVEDIEHLEWTTILDVSVASQFNAVNLMSECEGSFLERDACSKFTVQESNFGVSLCWCEVKDGQDLIRRENNN